MITIGTTDFDLKRGEIILPEPDAIPFRSNTAPGIGIQVTSDREPGFTLTLTRYDEVANVATFRGWIQSQIGTLVDITDRYDTVTISYTGLGYLFAVTQARVIESKAIAAWQGYRLGVHYNYEPAIRIVSQWTMYAVPD